jgi:hypothetical protein
LYQKSAGNIQIATPYYFRKRIGKFRRFTGGPVGQSGVSEQYLGVRPDISPGLSEVFSFNSENIVRIETVSYSRNLRGK